MYRFEFSPGCGSIQGQSHPKKLLSAFLQKGAIPHALLFSGIDGVGKHTTAMSFAMANNCTNRPPAEDILTPEYAADSHRQSKDITPILPCGECISCRKILSGNHPDIIQINPSGSMIKISQIRALCQTLSMKPYEAYLRVVILSDAHYLNPEASNALLKMLEEPPDRTLLILITSLESMLLPTILSRCQRIRFSPIPVKDLEALLMSEYGTSLEKASVIASLAYGSYTRAQHLIETQWIDRRNRLIAALGLDRPAGKPSIAVSALLGAAEHLSKNKEEWSEALQILKSWTRDLIMAKFYPGHIMNKDKVDVIQQVSEQMEYSKLLAQMSFLHTAEKQIPTHLNTRLLAETLILKLASND